MASSAECVDPQPGILGDQRCHLAEPDLAAAQRGVVTPGVHDQFIDLELDPTVAHENPDPVWRIIDTRRDRVAALGHEVKPVTLPQVADLEGARFSATEVGGVVRVDVAIPVLVVFAGSRFQPGIEQILTVPAACTEPEHRQSRFAHRVEVELDAYAVG